MNILVIIGCYPPDHSGAGLRILRTYSRLAEQYGVAFNVLAEPVRIPEGQSDYPNVTRIASAQFPLFLITKLAAVLIRNKNAIDLVHCIGPTRMTVVAAFLCRLLRIPYVTEMSIDYDVEKSKRNPVAKFILTPYFQPARAIALTPRIANIYEGFGTDKNHIYIRPNPVMMPDATGISPDEDFLVRVKTLPARHKHLVLGRICDRKNQLQAIEILKHMTPDHALILAGPVLDKNDEAYLQTLADTARIAEIEDRVLIYPQAVKKPEFLYQEIASLWCVSIFEGLPNVVLEALWNGRPVFVNKDLGLGGWLITDVNGLEIDLDADLSVPARRIQDKMQAGYDSATIQKTSRAAFNPDMIIDQTMVVLKQAAGEK